MYEVVGKLICIGRTRQPRIVYEVAKDGVSRIAYRAGDSVRVSETIKEAGARYGYESAANLHPYSDELWQACQEIIRQKNQFRKYYTEVIAALRRGEIPQGLAEWTPPGCGSS